MWHLELASNGSTVTNSTFVTEADPARRFVYAFGVDPVWKGATNELLYYNSLKMKMAVIFGVGQARPLPSSPSPAPVLLSLADASDARRPPAQVLERGLFPEGARRPLRVRAA